MSSEKAAKWQSQREKKPFYILRRALFHGLIGSAIFSSLMIAVNTNNEFREIHSIIIFCIISFIIWSVLGILSAFGDWNSNERKYQTYLKN